MLLTAALLFAAPARGVTAKTTRVSVSSSEVEGDNNSFAPVAISATGRFTAFESFGEVRLELVNVAADERRCTPQERPVSRCEDLPRRLGMHVVEIGTRIKLIAPSANAGLVSDR